MSNQGTLIEDEEYLRSSSNQSIVAYLTYRKLIINKGLLRHKIHKNTMNVYETPTKGNNSVIIRTACMILLYGTLRHLEIYKCTKCGDNRPRTHKVMARTRKVYDGWTDARDF